MRIAFIISFAANAVLSAVSYIVLPGTVAVHFGWGGVADGWASSSVNSLLFLGLQLLLFTCIYFSPRLLFVFPAKWINLPNRQYWLAPDNRPAALAKASVLMYQFGFAMFLFLFAADALTIKANLSDPVRLNESLFLVFLGFFLVYTVAWTVVFFRSFRVPGSRDG